MIYTNRLVVTHTQFKGRVFTSCIPPFIIFVLQQNRNVGLDYYRVIIYLFLYVNIIYKDN